MEFRLDDIESLVDLGLTLLQAKVFLTLVQSGTLNAKTISKVSKVSRADTYRVLDNLHELGIIEKKITKPTEYQTIPTKDALDILMERQTSRHKELKVKTANLLLRYQELPKSIHFSQSGFIFVPSREALIKRLKKAINNSQKSIDVATSCNRLIHASYNLYDNLEKAWNRGVRGRAIIECSEEIDNETVKKFWRSPRAEIRYVPAVPRTVMAMYDKREIFVFTKPTAKLSGSPALWSNVPSLVAMAEDYFEVLWITGLEESKYQTDKT